MRLTSCLPQEGTAGALAHRPKEGDGHGAKTMMTWSFPAQSGSVAPKKTEYQQVIQELAKVAAQITSGTGDQSALKQQRIELITRFHQIKDFKLPD
jgi:hypothetical protein